MESGDPLTFIPALPRRRTDRLVTILTYLFSMSDQANISRRQLLQRGTALAVLTAGPSFRALAQQSSAPDLVLLNLADVHSAYDRLPQLLTLIREIKERQPQVPHVLLFNGDIFELGNVVAQRSKGAADYSFLRAISKEIPVIFNIGNHESDFMEHQEFVRRARGVGISVITNLYDRRSGLPYARTFTTIQLGERAVPVLGLAVNALTTYPKAVRDTLLPPDPVEFFQATYPALTAGAPFSIILSHAGVVPDKAILGALKGQNLVIGGHDHLHLKHETETALYLHNGFKGELLNVVNVKLTDKGVNLTSQDYAVTDTLKGDNVLSGVIAAQQRLHLTPEDTAIVGRVSKAYSVQEAAQWAVETVRRVTGADIVAINHTSFGRGFKAGAVQRKDFNEFLRFDNKLVKTTIDAATLRDLLALANQHRGVPFEKLTGDFIYTNAVIPEDGKIYTLVTVDFLALPQNQPKYFGKSGMVFEQVAQLTSKAVLEAELGKQTAVGHHLDYTG